MDFHLDDGTGRDAALIIREMFQHPVRFLSRDGSGDARLAAVEAGAIAYILKSGPASEVIDAVCQVAQGGTMISPAAIARLVNQGMEGARAREGLSPRERQVLQLTDGVASRKIAQQLGLSYSTVRSHVRSISSKLETTPWSTVWSPPRC